MRHGFICFVCSEKLVGDVENHRAIKCLKSTEILRTVQSSLEKRIMRSDLGSSVEMINTDKYARKKIDLVCSSRTFRFPPVMVTLTKRLV